MRGALLVESLTPFITRGFSDPNARVLQGVRKAWEVVERKDRELRGSSNRTIGGYHRWLRAYTQGLDWLPKLRAAKEEEVEALEESEEVQALKAELEKAQVVKEKFKTTAVRI